MTDDQSLDLDLLSLCAILRWFDGELLRELAGSGEDAIETLLASDRVVPADEPAGACRLQADIRAEALARLRAERPSDELTLHRRIFEHVLSQMRKSFSDDRRVTIEHNALYHLGELFRLYAAHQEWKTFGNHIADVYATAPQQPRLLNWLSFYDGFVSIRTQDYERGELILTTLLAASDLENELRVQILNALGQANHLQAHYDRALAFYRQVYTLATQTNNLFYQATALVNMGTIYSEIHYYEQALELTTQSLQLFHTLGDSYAEAHALYSSGHLAMWQGRWQMARSYFQESIKLCELLGVQARLAYLYWGQGFLSHMLANEDESEVAYQRALQIARSEEHRQTELLMDSLLYLGFLYQTQDRCDEALSLYQQAAEEALVLRNQHGLSLTHYRRGNVFARQGRLDEAFAAYEAAIDGIEAMRGATETEEIKIGLLGTAQQVYEAMVLLCLARDRPAEAFAYVERARSRAFLDMLAKKRSQSESEASPELYDALAQPVATLAEVQSRLRGDALLVEYFTTGVLPRGESLINKLPPENTRLREHLALPPRTIIFAVTRERLEVFHTPLDPNTLRPQPGDPGPGRRLLRDRLLAHLHAQLIAPIAPLLQGRELLYLIPHGPLHYVPFMALRAADGAQLLQADGPAIALAPSATVLLRNCLDRPPVAATHAMPLLALGYNDEDEEALRYAEDEARHIARLAAGQVWTGADAKSERLLAEGRHTRWLHIAGHAVYDPHDPLGSYLQLGKDDRLSARAIMGGLELDAELVTLSACMSGLTHVVPGDELLGLQRAFLYAGAPAVVCALWEAADLVALLVMDRFYMGLRDGQPPAAALRDAQVAVRAMTGRDLLAALDRWRAEDPTFAVALGEQPEVPADALDAEIYADPFYWAPFMLIGRPD